VASYVKAVKRPLSITAADTSSDRWQDQRPGEARFRKKPDKRLSVAAQQGSKVMGRRPLLDRHVTNSAVISTAALSATIRKGQKIYKIYKNVSFIRFVACAFAARQQETTNV